MMKALKIEVLASFLILVACDAKAPISKHMNATVEAAAIQIELHSLPDRVQISLKNNSSKALEVSSDSALGYGISDNRIQLKVRANGDFTAPCMHLDLPLQENSTKIVNVGGSLKNSIPSALIRKVYCMKRGVYFLSAEYLSQGVVKATSNEISFRGE